jgi:phosphoribosylaminoimidazole-succinocarboxamide synthase
LEGQKIPVITDEKINEISNRYIELYENITGKEFEKANTDKIEDRIDKNVTEFLNSLVEY